MRKLLEMIRRLARSRSARLIGPAAACALLAACPSFNLSSADQAALTDLGKTAITQLQRAKAEALAATPVDQYGADCVGSLPDPAKTGDLGVGSLAVAAAIQREAVASGGNIDAEVLSLYQPNSPQFEWAVTTIETACIAKARQVVKAGQTSLSTLATLPLIFSSMGLTLGG